MKPLIEVITATVAGMPRAAALAEVRAWLDSLSNVQLAALRYDWDHTWARREQLIERGRWRSWGFLAGRGFGKTRPVAEYINAAVERGAARRIGLIAQNEDAVYDVQACGETGLVTLSPPWFKARWEKSRVIWPNGVECVTFTPEKPGNIRGPGLDHAWATELQSWPTSTREEAFRNLQLMTRIGEAKTLWDATPKPRHPIIASLLKRAELDPVNHRVIRGSTRDNAANLAQGYIEDVRRDIAGTRREQEELEGKFFGDAAGALWAQDWIDRARRDAPLRVQRRVIGVDPAITSGGEADATGMVQGSLTDDGQIHIEWDGSAVMPWEAWGARVVERYVSQQCDCVIVETNRGGEGCVSNIRVAARNIGLRVEVVKLDAPTRWNASVIYVKEVNSAGSKGARAEPAAALAKQGRISHSNGADLEELENEMCSWEPSDEGQARSRRAPSPNRLDAAVEVVWELAQLWSDRRDVKAGFRGVQRVQQALAPASRENAIAGASVLADALRRSGWGDGSAGL